MPQEQRHYSPQAIVPNVVSNLNDGDLFSVDGGHTWFVCYIAWGQVVSVYTTPRRDDAAPTVRIEADGDTPCLTMSFEHVANSTPAHASIAVETGKVRDKDATFDELPMARVVSGQRGHELACPVCNATRIAEVDEATRTRDLYFEDGRIRASEAHDDVHLEHARFECQSCETRVQLPAPVAPWS